MPLPPRVCVVTALSVGFALLPGESMAGSVVGRLELPPAPERPAVAAKGFLDRAENPLSPVRPVSVGPRMIVVLEGAPQAAPPGQVSWDLVGESFARPVIAAPVGAEVVIKNTSKTPRTIVALEDLKLIPSGPINPTGPKSFRTTEPRIYTIVDKDAPHLRGTLVVVTTPFIATVDGSGKFDFGEVPAGSYKLRVFYKDNWIDRPDEAVTVPAKGKAEVSVKVPAGYPLKK